LWRGDITELLVIRDHLGFRPVHWALEDSTFVAASTLRAVRNQLSRQPPLDAGHAAQFITERQTSVTDTFWKGINRLAPAGKLRVRPDLGVSAGSYWDAAPRVDAVTPGQAVDGVRTLFEQAVRAQSRARGPIGVQLSGGFDSSTVLAVASRLGTETLALSLAFDEPEADERRYSAAAAAHAGVGLTAIDARTVPFIDLTDDMRTSGSAFRTFDTHWYDALAAELTLRGGRVMLTGHGGDHLLYGGSQAHIDLVRRLRLIEALRQVPYPGDLKHRSTQLVRAVRGEARRSLKRAGGARALRVWRMAHRLGRQFHPPSPGVLSPLAEELLRSGAMPQEPPGGGRWASSAEQRLRWYREPFAVFLAEAWDHLAAAICVEERHPFYDIRLVEFGLGLSPAIVRPRGEYRGLHRQAFASDLPPLVDARTGKADFTRPVTAVAVNSMSEDQLRALLDPIHSLVNVEVVTTTLQRARRYVEQLEGRPVALWDALACLRLGSWTSVWQPLS
jgi:asparagine synthase (glutamine-hydrolysing)